MNKTTITLNNENTTFAISCLVTYIKKHPKKFNKAKRQYWHKLCTSMATPSLTEYTSVTYEDLNMFLVAMRSEYPSLANALNGNYSIHIGPRNAKQAYNIELKKIFDQTYTRFNEFAKQSKKIYNAIKKRLNKDVRMAKHTFIREALDDIFRGAKLVKDQEHNCYAFLSDGDPVTEASLDTIVGERFSPEKELYVIPILINQMQFLEKKDPDNANYYASGIKHIKSLGQKYYYLTVISRGKNINNMRSVTAYDVKQIAHKVLKQF